MTNSTTKPSWAQHTDLTGLTILVAGGSGGVGEGVVRTLIDDGARVIATGRDRTRLQELGERIDSARLSVTALNALDPDIDERIAALAEEPGRFDGVVVSVASKGAWGRKPLLSLSDAEWEAQRIVPDLTSIFRIYRASVPHMRRTGALVLLNGYSADLPFPGNAGVALAAAAAKSMTASLAAELAESGPRVYDVIMGLVRTRARRLAGIDDPGWIDGTEVGAHVAELIAATSPLNALDLHYFVDKALGPQPSPPER